MLPARLRRFTKDEGGLAAVEFGFILPWILVIFFGVVEVSLALSCRADVTNVAATTADLVAQDSEITNTDMTGIFAAVNAILYPYDTSAAKITVTSLIDNGSTDLTQGKVAWSDTKNGTARAKDAVVTLPAGLMTKSGSVIMAEVTYSYASPTSKTITGPLTMTNTFYTKPRRVTAITRKTS